MTKNELALFTGTKDEIKSMASEILRAVSNGDANALTVFAKLKAMEEMAKIAKTAINAYAVDELCKYDAREKVVVNGYEMTIRESGVRYDYSDCNDPVYKRLLDRANEINELLKAREQFLRSVKGYTTIIDDETGEVVKVVEPVRKSTTAIICA